MWGWVEKRGWIRHENKKNAQTPRRSGEREAQGETSPRKPLTPHTTHAWVACPLPTNPRLLMNKTPLSSPPLRRAPFHSTRAHQNRCRSPLPLPPAAAVAAAPHLHAAQQATNLGAVCVHFVCEEEGKRVGGSATGRGIDVSFYLQQTQTANQHSDSHNTHIYTVIDPRPAPVHAHAHAHTPKQTHT